MIDLDQLRRSVERPGGEKVVVTRRFLKQCASEIAAGRAAEARLRASSTVADVLGGLEPRVRR